MSEAAHTGRIPGAVAPGPLVRAGYATLVAVNATQLVVRLAVGEGSAASLGVLAISTVVAVAGETLIRFGRPVAAARGLVAGAMGAAIYAIAAGGYDSPVFLGFVFAALFAGLALSGRAALGVGAVGIATCLGALLIQGSGGVAQGPLHEPAAAVASAQMLGILMTGLLSLVVCVQLRRSREATLREEQQLRDLVQQCPIGVIATDLEPRTIYANEALATLLGAPSADALIGRTLSELGGRLDRVQRHEFALFGVRGWRYEGPWASPWGPERMVSVWGIPSFDDEGRISGGQALIEDQTEWRSLEQQLERSERIEAIGTFVGGVAHDFNNNLTVVLSQTDALLGRLPEGAAAHETVRAIDVAAESAAELTRSLLSFGRRRPAQTERLDLCELVGHTAALLRRTLGEQVELRARVGREPCPVLASRSELEQAVVTLAVRARDEAPQGCVITLEVGRRGDMAFVEVIDDGPRIEAEAREHVFDFAGPSGSVGLRLATVLASVRRAGGEVRLESGDEAVNCFTLEFPLARSDA